IVFDAETGTTVKLGSTSEYETKTVHVSLADGRVKMMAIGIEPGPSTAPSAAGKICHIRLSLISLDDLAKFRNGTRRENTDFVRTILSALAVIHHRWPLWRDGQFYTDRAQFEGRDLTARFAYDVPGEDEIFRLAETLSL